MTKTEAKTKSNAKLIMRFASIYSRPTIHKCDIAECARICDELKKRGIITEQEVEEMTRYFNGF